MRGGGGREDGEVARKLKSMEMEKMGDGEESPRPAVKYYGWKAMPFIIGASCSCVRACVR
jgi:peptide/histidine transporter 3/4